MSANVDCKMQAQGFAMGSCSVKVEGKKLPACVATLKKKSAIPSRLIHAVHLSRPENYLSIYQSDCNMTCKKCHSAEFSQVATGSWMTPEEILARACAYEEHVTLWEPRQKVTAWHAHQSCKCCGSCIGNKRRSPQCPGVLSPDAIVLSPQGFGPARNIVGFTGGDLTCCPEFYGKCSELIKSRTKLWVLIETNGYGLTPQNTE